MEELIIAGVSSGVGGLIVGFLLPRRWRFWRRQPHEDWTAGLTRYQAYKAGRK